MFDKTILAKAETLIKLCFDKHITLTAAESCTGGLLMAAFTSVGGVSEVFNGGYVTYSNDEKMDMVNVSQTTLDRHGAVSDEVVREMADGAMLTTGADLAIAISGVAGPTGGSAEKPVGLVHFGVCTAGCFMETHKIFENLDRNGVRLAAVEYALDLLIAEAQKFKR